MFYPLGISISSVKTSRDEIKFTLDTRVKGCDKKSVKLFLPMRAVALHLIFKVVSQEDFLAGS